MTFLLDANVLVYSVVPGERREACADLLDAIARGQAAGRTSAAVMEEAWHLELSARVPGLEGLTSRAFSVLRPLLPVTDEAFERALALEAPRLGANDRVHAGTCLAYGIEVIVSADTGFDGISGLRRIDPIDAATLTR